MEILKVGDKRVRIITKGPKDMDTQINMDEEVDEVDPFDNKIKVSNGCRSQRYFYVHFTPSPQHTSPTMVHSVRRGPLELELVLH